MAITLDEANKMVAGAIAKAEELNIKINVAVVDAGGRLLAFNRMDGAIWGGMYGSQGKAKGSGGLTLSITCINLNITFFEMTHERKEGSRGQLIECIGVCNSFSTGSKPQSYRPRHDFILPRYLSGPSEAYH